MGQEAAAQFDALAAMYEDMATWPFRRDMEIPNVLAVLGDLHNRDVLDFGCGNGMYARWMKQRGARRVVGYDVSEGMLEYARQREARERLGIEHVSALGRDCEGVFDLVLSVYVLPYATNADELFEMCATMARALKPGGRLVALPIHPDYVRQRDYYEPYGFRMMPDGADVDGGKVRLDLCKPPFDVSVTAYYWSKESLESAMHQAGLSPVQWVQHGLLGGDRHESADRFMRAHWQRPHAAILHCCRI